MQLIGHCVTSASFSFMLNGKSFDNLILERGIRQGDPISLYLFIICSEIFSCILQDLQLCGRIQGIKVAWSAPAISHLFFVDDTLIFVEANLSEAQALKDDIALYERVSGQLINYDKSGIIFSLNTPPEYIANITALFGINSTESHGKYLVCLLLTARTKEKSSQSSRTGFGGEFKLGKVKCLSRAGK